MQNNRNLITILNDFSVCFDKRSILFALNDEIFLKILEWNLNMWKLKWQSFQKKSDDRTYWFELSTNLNMIIRQYGKRAMNEEDFFTTFFLENFQKHLEAHKRESVLVNKRTRYYVEDMLWIFYQLLFDFEEKADYGKTDDLWRRFPNDWKITKANLTNNENLFSKTSLDEFIKWTRQRLLHRLDFDSPLNDLSINLFPEVEPTTWAQILIFALLPYDPENRIRSIGF